MRWLRDVITDGLPPAAPLIVLKACTSACPTIPPGPCLQAPPPAP